MLPSSLSRLRIRTSLLQNLPRATRWYPYYFPFFPMATRQLDLTGYDLVVSSDAALIKGIRIDDGAEAYLLLPFAHALPVERLRKPIDTPPLPLCDSHFRRYGTIFAGGTIRPPSASISSLQIRKMSRRESRGFMAGRA